MPGKAQCQQNDLFQCIEFKGEAITITIKDKAAVKGTFTVDPEKSPATMSISYEKDGKAITIPAIYELKGDDLKLCHPNSEGGDRPSAFEASATTGLMTLKPSLPALP